MKRIIFIIFTFLFLISAHKYRAQEEPEIPAFQEYAPYVAFEMNEQEEQSYLEKITPKLKAELLYIKETDKNKYYELLREAYLKNMDYPFFQKREKTMHETDKKIFELEVISESLAARFKKANQNDKTKIRSQLSTTLDELFDMREEQRKLEVQVLEGQLAELKKSLKMRLDNKKEIIQRRIQDLLGEDKYLDWN